MQNTLMHITTHDSLTALPNRMYFRESINQCMQSVNKTSGYLALLFISFDNFKNINDELGRQIGDILLVSIAGNE
tara:strand:+ start:460 stop:684 length:225 start_codon:yes stop_codon:yes gene_type:complete